MIEIVQTWAVGVTVVVAVIFAILALWGRYGEVLVHGCTFLFEDAAEIAGKLLSVLAALGIVIAVCTGCYGLGRAILGAFE